MDTIFSILTAVVAEATNPLTAGLAIAVIGLNIHFGLTGLINFGQAGFMLLGAYGFAISLREGIPLPLAVLIGLAAAALFALLLGLPTLQLRGDYLAIVTISAAEIIRFVGRLSSLQDLTGGALGIRGQFYRGPFVELSPFSQDPAETFTLFPFTYLDVADGAQWVRIGSLLVFVVLVVAVVVVFRNARRAGMLARTAGESTDPVDPASDAVGPGPVSPADAIFDDTPAKLGSRTVVLLSALGVLAAAVLFFTVPLTYPQTGANGWWARLVAWVLVGLCTLLAAALMRSPWGRLLRGIREDEDAIRSLGRNVFAVKMQALVIGGLFGALGGMVYVIATTVQPDSLGRQTTFLIYTALLLGGLATIFGPVLGSVLFFSVRIFIRETADAYIPDSIMNTQESNSFAFIVVGLILVLLIVFRPQGILGNKKEVSVNV